MASSDDIRFDDDFQNELERLSRFSNTSNEPKMSSKAQSSYSIQGRKTHSMSSSVAPKSFSSQHSTELSRSDLLSHGSQSSQYNRHSRTKSSSHQFSQASQKPIPGRLSGSSQSTGVRGPLISQSMSQRGSRKVSFKSPGGIRNSQVLDRRSSQYSYGNMSPPGRTSQRGSIRVSAMPSPRTSLRHSTRGSASPRNGAAPRGSTRASSAPVIDISTRRSTQMSGGHDSGRYIRVSGVTVSDEGERRSARGSGKISLASTSRSSIRESQVSSLNGSIRISKVPVDRLSETVSNVGPSGSIQLSKRRESSQSVISDEQEVHSLPRRTLGSVQLDEMAKWDMGDSPPKPLGDPYERGSIPEQGRSSRISEFFDDTIMGGSKIVDGLQNYKSVDDHELRRSSRISRVGSTGSIQTGRSPSRAVRRSKSRRSSSQVSGGSDSRYSPFSHGLFSPKGPLSGICVPFENGVKCKTKPLSIYSLNTNRVTKRAKRYRCENLGCSEDGAHSDGCMDEWRQDSKLVALTNWDMEVLDKLRVRWELWNLEETEGCGCTSNIVRRHGRNKSLSPSLY